ncbi:hypothetical protein [Clostridium ganghwense]|uniref:Uncharacterized protein n=1 Tax=Clostridium ganghwense TaxID=312089 RepID=A0ABT4CQ23_9CLOT|nr:hypothetical protein [Clostridium ganghwense]MCY6371145.1 hypothetical protein [Clostridium ganghwense]
MNINESLVCPNCNSKYLKLKHEATYVYTYKINTPETGTWSNETETLPFLFDNRQQTNLKEYLECEKCGAKFPYSFDKDNPKIDLTISQKAIRSEYKNTPEFLG